MRHAFTAVMVIVGTDFSATAAIAVGEAQTLAGQLGLALQLVHVRQVPGSPAWSPNDRERAWLRSTRVDAGEVSLRRGSPWVELVRAAGEGSARLIVVGTHGNSGFQPVSLGSTASRLALYSPLPILLVGGRERLREAV